MIQTALAKPRILVVEDKIDMRNEMVTCLQDIPPNMRRQHGISDFEIDEADSVAKAESLLEQSKTPYDLVLLDLHLPKKSPGDGTEHLSRGLDLLRHIKESQTAKGIVVVSLFREYPTVIDSIRGGALDFVAKAMGPFEVTLQPQVLSALARLMAEESTRVLNQRVRDLAIYAEIGLAHSFRKIFKDLLDGVTQSADSIEKYVRERYGLDKEKDPYDSLVLKLRAHEKAVTHAGREWSRLQAELARDKALDVRNVGQMLRDIKDSLLSCLVVKRVALSLPDFEDKSVMTFEKDVEVVLREIIVGALSELPDYGEERQIKVSFTTEDTRARVRFEDYFEPIPEEKIQVINEGQRILPDAEFGRVWGLSVAQHVALRGGGELVVTTERGRNVITYHIPLADYA